MDEIKFLCTDVSEADRQYVLNILPKIPTKIVKFNKTEDGLIKLKLYTDCDEPEAAKLWIKQFEELSNTNYTITKTRKCTGTYLIFKQFLQCQRKTRCKNLYDISNRNRTKNTNCPSSIIIGVHSVKKRYQGKNKETGALIAELPCEIEVTVTHNHDVSAADELRFRKVSKDVEAKLIGLFKIGHSPTSALETIKLDIQLNCENYEHVLLDRKYCPDYMFCYHLYKKTLKKQYAPLNLDCVGQEFLKNRIKEYNDEVGEICAQIKFEESNYIICICPPLMKRVHQYCQSAGQMVFMDSIDTTDHGGSHVFILLTHDECGGLPLGVIITSSESANLVSEGFCLLKDIVGQEIFGGRLEGPEIFLTGDCLAEQSAIESMWPKSRCLSCVFHVLQSVKRWLIDGKNKIPQETQTMYFEDFKYIMFSSTVVDCFQRYQIAKDNIIHENYQNYFVNYWERRERWAMCHRNDLLTKTNNTNNLSAAVMKIINEKIFNRVKTFNVVQLIDFMFTKFVSYYEARLLDAVTDRLKNNFLRRTVKLPSVNLLERIQIINDTTIFVPSEKIENLLYVVNIDALLCTCFSDNTVRICKHIDWVCIVISSEKYNTAVNDVHKRQTWRYISTARSPPSSPIQNTSDGSIADTSLSPVLTVEPNQENAEIVERGLNLIDKIVMSITEYVKQSPAEIVPALENMYENVKKLRTVAGAATAFSNFGSELQLRKLKKYDSYSAIINKAKKRKTS